jgi:hypothetical protein
MAEVPVDPTTARELAELRRQGVLVFGPAPVSRTQPMATADVTQALPGVHLQLGAGPRWVQGYGGTAREALDDARRKLGGVKPTRRTAAA